MKVINSDLIRGNIDAIVLNLLLDGAKYGAEIQEGIRKKTNGLYIPPEQTLYSAYHRLEDLGFIKGKWGSEAEGTKRKYYSITPEGVQFFYQRKAEWSNAKRLIDILIG